MSDENVIYCLQTLAGFESSDIDCDDFDIVVNDDNQFTTMSIVETARLGYELAEKHIELITKKDEQIKMLREALKRTLNTGVEFINSCDVDDEEDRATLETNFNNSLISAENALSATEQK